LNPLLNWVRGCSCLRAREAEVGSLLSITRTNGTAPARFTAPTRSAGYQLPSYEVAGLGSRTVTHL